MILIKEYFTNKKKGWVKKRKKSKNEKHTGLF